MSGPVIETQRGQIIVTDSGTAKIEWSSEFQQKWQGNFSRAQRFVDSKVLKLSSQNVPTDTGSLMKSGELGTVIGSGTVSWISRYARKQYYGTHTWRRYDVNRGAFWFERMKAVHKGEIVNGAKRIAGGAGK